MPTLTVDAAAQQISQALLTMDSDDVLQVYNELFPEEPVDKPYIEQNASALKVQIRAHINGGLEPEEVVDLWNVVFPSDRDVYFDEEENQLHFAAGETSL